MSPGRQASIALEVAYECHEAEETEAALKGRTEKRETLKENKI